jgi:hypothetical protein
VNSKGEKRKGVERREEERRGEERSEEKSTCADVQISKLLKMTVLPLSTQIYPSSSFLNYPYVYFSMYSQSKIMVATDSDVK